MSHTKKLAIGSAVFLIVCSFLFWKANISDTQAVANKTFPKMWNEMALPVVPDTTITEVNRVFQDGNGISINLETEMVLEDFTKLLEDEFFDRNFEIYIPEEETATKYSNTYDSKDAGVTVTATSDPTNPSRSIANIVIVRNTTAAQPLRGRSIKNTTTFFAD